MNGFITITKETSHLVSDFIQSSGTALENFRYYKTRPLEVLQKHLVTYLYCYSDSPVAYGHLDIEDTIIWLGIAVSEKYQGKGFGKKMMKQLISFAEKHQLSPIRLSVDEENKKAIQLYHKFGFKTVKKQKKILFLEKVV